MCSGLAGIAEHALMFGTSLLLNAGDIDMSDKGGWPYALELRIVPGRCMTTVQMNACMHRALVRSFVELLHSVLA